MIKKKSLLKISLILFAIFTVVALCMCSVLSLSNMAEAKSISSNGNSVKFKCTGDDYLYVYSEGGGLHINKWVQGEYDCFKEIDDLLQSAAPGATWECDPDKSYFGKASLGVKTDFVTMVLIQGTATLGRQTTELYVPFYVGVAKEDGAEAYDFPSYVNGSYVDLPLISDESADNPIYFQPGASYYFTNYSFSSSISISGNVVDEAGNAVYGAKVSVTPENTANAVVPDPVMTVNGTFTFENVDPEILPAMINVEKDGYTFVPVRITENDIVDGKIVLSNLVLNKSTEVAQTMDINFYFVIALMGIALCGIIVAVASRSKAKNI